MLSNEIYITVRDAIELAAEERGRSYEREHEAHYMAMEVIRELARAGYAITRLPVAA